MTQRGNGNKGDGNGGWDPRFPREKDPNAIFRAMSQGQGDPALLPPGAPAPQQPIIPVPVPVDFPPHLFPPSWVSTLDIKTAATVTAGTTLNLITFVAPEGATTYLTHYAIFNDGNLASNFDFFPKIDGRRIYPYHGDPLSSNPIGTSGFRIYLGVTADIGNEALIQALAYMQPGQVLTWDVQNRDVVDATMAVRVVGYIDKTKQRTQQRFGG